MKRYILLVISISLGTRITAQTGNYSLPLVENGQWFIARGDEKIKLPQEYNYVNHFDNLGYAYFCNGTNYGVIDTTGKVKISGKQFEIVQYSNGLFRYAVEKGYILQSLKNNTKTPCSWSKKLDENWLCYKQEGNSYVMHTSWKNAIPILSEKSITSMQYGFLYVMKYDLSYSLYNSDGVLLEENPEIVREINTNFYVKGAKNHFILNSNGKITLPINASNVQVKPNYITFCSQGKVHLIEQENNLELFSADGDNLTPYKNKYYVYKDFRVGLLDAKGKQILPPIYRNFYELQGNYVVNRNGNSGLCDSEGKELIPCVFQSITPQGEYYRTTIFTGTCGLYSGVTFKEIYAPYFNKINIDQLNLRAWDNTRLVLVEMDKNHNEKNRLYLNNVISINTYKDNSKLNVFDPRLFKLGWFYTSKMKTNEETKSRTTTYSWGIQIDDSVRIKPRFRTPTYVANANFSLVPTKKLDNIIETSLLGSIEIGNTLMGHDAIHNEKLKTMNTSPILLFDSTDFYSKEYARMHTNKSFGIVTKDGISHEYFYVDNDYDGYARFCKSGKLEAETNNKSNVTYPDFILNSRLNTSDAQKNIRINNASWNYLNVKGDSIFKEPFLYASNFYKKTAVVQGKKGFGVIRNDSIIIPTVFSSIARIPQAKDTLFLVTRKREKMNYLDSNLHELKITISAIVDRSDSLIVIRNGTNYQLLSSANKILESGPRKYFLMNKHYVIHKERKQFIIRNSSLQEIGRSPLKPIEFINDTHFFVEYHKRKAVLNVQGDTLIDFRYTDLENHQRFILGIDEEFVIHVFNNKFKQIIHKKPKKSYSVKTSYEGEIIALQIDNTIHMYNQLGKHVSKFHLDKKQFIVEIYRNLITTSDNQFLTVEGVPIPLKNKYYSTLFVDSNYFGYQDIYGKCHLHTPNCSDVLSKEIKYFLKYHGDDVFSYIDSLGVYTIHDLKNNQKYLYAKEVIGKFSDGFLLLKIENTYEFVDRNFQNIFQKSFDFATPYKHGMAAVMLDKNWTIIGKQGFQKSLPNHEEIECIGPNLYCIETHNYYGIYDSHGKVIVPASYLKIEFTNGIIQATRLGVIDYFTMDGKKI